MPTPPYLGSAYYPEAWPWEQMDRDIAQMAEAGLTVARMGEFAWSTMEPREGEFHFDWLHQAVEKLARAGLATLLGTPSAAPPQWLASKHPEILFVYEDGRQATHGARRHTCPTQPVYREYCEKIVMAMVREFGDDARVIGWQIDNELHPLGPWFDWRSCCCAACVAAFRAGLRAQYGSIEALNAAWNLALWSQAYVDFEHLPLPRRDTWHHPSLLLAWEEFASNAYAGFVRHQADLLHAHVKVPVGTDMMPTHQLDYVSSQAPLDVVQFNHYHDETNLWQVAFWYDFIRTLKPVRFWNTETQTCWNGGVSINGGHKPPGWCRANSWLPITLGGEANLYWLWRQHWAGQELMHGSLVSAAGRPLPVFGEVRTVAAEFKRASGFLHATLPERSGLALMWSQHVQRMYHSQPTAAADFHYEHALVEHVYQPLLRRQWRPDVIPPAAGLDPYRVVLMPLLLTLEEAGLPERLEAWVRAGGTLLAGPLTDVRTREGTHYQHAPCGRLEAWTGARCVSALPAQPTAFPFAWGGQEHLGAVWHEAWEAPGEEVLARYAGGWPAGYAAIVRHRLGAGQIVLLGTVLPGPVLHALLLELAAAAGVRPVACAGENVLVVPRAGERMRGLIAQELWGRAGWVELECGHEDVLTGAAVAAGRLALEPYAVRVLREAPRR